MPTSLFDQEVNDILTNISQPIRTKVKITEFAEPVEIIKPFASPEDWRDKWIYFLMIDRFNNPFSPPLSQQSDWDRCTEARQGGTFKGIKDKLGYIKALGAGAIWLTPVLKNRQSVESPHGYGIMDFLEVDPRFATDPEQAENEFIQLVEEAHALDLYVILDIVINHSGDIFTYDVNGEAWDARNWMDAAGTIYWRDQNGQARLDWTSLPPPEILPRDGGIWPRDFQQNKWFRRQGKGGPIQGDFETLKEFKTELTDEYNDHPVWNLFIRAYQYINC